MSRDNHRFDMILRALFFSLTLTEFKFAAAELAPNQIERAKTPSDPTPVLDDVRSCLLDTEGCGKFYRPVPLRAVFDGRRLVPVYN